MTFAILLRSYRRAAGLTQAALAERASLSVRGLQHLEAGDAQPTRATLSALVATLQLTNEDRTPFEAAAFRTRRQPPDTVLGRASVAASQSARPGSFSANFPEQVTSFIGRETELAALRLLLPDARLLTLVGTGGCGKTRLALRLSADVVDQYSAGVWLVEFAPVTDPSLVPQTLADSGGIGVESDRPILSTCVDVLRSKQQLLVLDNCEHLLDACARLTDVLLRACPDLTILATSRERLSVAGERAWRVPSLGTPDGHASQNLCKLMEYEAVRLFVERAAAVQPGFVATERNAGALVEICQRLDGIPLALELAAARMRALGVEQLLDRLEDRFDVLTGGSRVAAPRQQTLRATVDWSYTLLSEAERMVLACLAVFAGGWTLAAAEAVCSGPGLPASKVLDVLTSLVDRSLVIAETSPDEPCVYRLLETLRQYAGERLEAMGQAPAAHARHAQYYVALAEQAATALIGPRQLEWLDQLERERDNLRAALRWVVGEGNTEAGLRLAGGLLWWWIARGHRSEGSEWLAALLEQPGPCARRWRMRALQAAGTLAWIQGYQIRARAYYEQSLEIARDDRDHLYIAAALEGLGRVAIALGNGEQGRANNEASLVIQREVGDHHGAGYSLFFLGSAELAEGDYVSAAGRYRASLAEFRLAGDRFGQANALRALGDVVGRSGDVAGAEELEEQSLSLAWALGNREGVTLALDVLGAIAMYEQDHVAARKYFAEGLEHLRDLGARARVADSLERFAGLAAAENQAERALRLAGAAAALRAASGATTPVSPPRHWVTWRPPCDSIEKNSAWAEGYAMSQEDAIAYALNPSSI